MKRLLIYLLVIAIAASMILIGTGCKEEAAPAEEIVEEAPAEEATEEVEEEAPAEEEAMEEEADLEIVLLIKLQHPFFDRQEEGLKEASADLGVKAIMVGPAEADASQQVALVEDLIARGVDAIIICPNDPAALDPVAQKAMDAGILTFAYEGPTMQNVVYDVEAFNNDVFGRHKLDKLVEIMGTSGKYVNYVGSLTAEVHNQWVDARVEYAEENYPDLIEAESRIESKEDTTVAYERTLELLIKHPDLKGFIASSAASAPGIALAIEEKGLEDETVVVGYGFPSANQEYLKSGAMDVGCLYDPKDVGYLLTWVAAMALRGEPIETGMEVPGLGMVTVDNNIVFGGEDVILDITAENVDDYLFY